MAQQSNSCNNDISFNYGTTPIKAESISISREIFKHSLFRDKSFNLWAYSTIFVLRNELRTKIGFHPENKGADQKCIFCHYNYKSKYNPAVAQNSRLLDQSGTTSPLSTDAHESVYPEIATRLITMERSVDHKKPEQRAVLRSRPSAKSNPARALPSTQSRHS